jgi:hypothetical protein
MENEMNVNEMARTSTRHGQEMDEEVVGILLNNGWVAHKNNKVMAVADDGRGVKPDVLASKNGVHIVIENKSNGKDVGTLHEKWAYAVMKTSKVAHQLQMKAVLVIDDESNKLGKFIVNVIKPLGGQLGVEVLTKEEFHGFAAR